MFKEKKRNQGAGGTNTNVNGHAFEKVVDVVNLFEGKNYTIKPSKTKNTQMIVDKKGNILYTRIKYKGAFNKFFRDRDINVIATKNNKCGVLSKGMGPDEAIFDHKNNVLVIIEKKYQNGDGSVDEKLQTCDFKKRQYKKLCDLIGAKIEYVFILSPYFEENEKKYKDVFEYIKDVGCHYYFQSNFSKICDDFFNQ